MFRRVFACLVILSSVLIPVARVGAAPAGSARLAGPARNCSNIPGTTDAGHTQLVVSDQRNLAPGFRAVRITLHLRDAGATHTYGVWVADLNLAGGVIIGCSAGQIGTVTTDSSGTGSFRGTATYYTGHRNLQVFASDGFGIPGFVSSPIPIDIP